MDRATFMAAVQDLAEGLGAELWEIIESHAEQARLAALDVASRRLAAALSGDASEQEPEAAIADDVRGGESTRTRAPRRCSKCRELGHNRSTCPVGDESAVAADPDPSDGQPSDDSDEDEDAPTERPPARPARADRFARIEASAQRRVAVR